VFLTLKKLMLKKIYLFNKKIKSTFKSSKSLKITKITTFDKMLKMKLLPKNSF
jgi:hypothetical protein